ncbi:DUF2169 domain-containing protein [Dyella sp. SG609]|uniref:DUF2169 family type VI secretion system accessory protein n=1 Tax=Dyella sp. SG609 TaxID=2587018 RepID=UPI0014451AD8|nr:DUF2169 domain-containing protein [Dyella sp. SG609]NKJ20435.1 uncharacterized protein YjbI with pentapeptide repeats [Dyella sp. SG609]
MKIVKPMTLGLMHRPYRWQGRDRLLVATLGFFALGGRPDALLRDNLQWRKVMSALPPGRPLDELMPKTRGEVLLAGSAHAANGLAVTEQMVRLVVGSAMSNGGKSGGVDKRLRVVGDRQWMYGMLPWLQVTEPLPFTQMPLTWSRAYGGAGHPANPEGRGYARHPLAAFFGRNHGDMPNVEQPQRPVRSPRRRYAPAGFGQLDVGWTPRRQWIGSYGKRWRSEAYPGLADDTHPEFFNAAPLDQRIEGFFTGGETYRLEGMHPRLPVIEGCLPEFRPRAFAHRAGQPADAVDEVALSFDTVWFFPDAELGVTIHRGEIEVEDSLALDVEALMVAYEHADDAPRALSHYGEVLALRLNRDTAARHVFNEAQLTPEPDAALRAARQTEVQEEQQRRVAVRAAREAGLAAEFEASSGMPAPPPAPAPLAVDLPVPGEAAIRRGDFDLSPMLDAVERIGRAAKEQAQARRDEAAAQLAQLPELPPAVPATTEEALARAAGQGGAMGALGEFGALAGVPPVAVEQIHELQRKGRLASPQPSVPGLPLQPAVAAAIGQWLLLRVREGGSLHGCDLAGADLRGAMLSGADLRGALLEASDLRGAQLDGADLSEVALTGATMDAANCAAACFDGANLARTRAHDAVFRGASFAGTQAGDADWSRADLAGARFERWIAPNIVLEGANLEHATLADCVLLHAKADGSRWAHAAWQRTVALGSSLAGSDWREAALSRSVLMECRLTDSHWAGADLARVQGGGGADWSRADLQRVRADHSSWRGANLADANLAEGQFRECDFSGARLPHAVLERTLFYRSLFMGGELTGCHAEAADFYQAMCRRADFREADLREANFVQAECAEARFDHARLEGVRLEPGRRLP